MLIEGKLFLKTTSSRFENQPEFRGPLHFKGPATFSLGEWHSISVFLHARYPLFASLLRDSFAYVLVSKLFIEVSYT